MGSYLRKIGKYCDCLEDLSEYEIKVQKVRKVYRKKQNNPSEVSEMNINEQKSLDLAKIQSLNLNESENYNKKKHTTNKIVNLYQETLEEDEKKHSHIILDVNSQVELPNFTKKMYKKHQQKQQKLKLKDKKESTQKHHKKTKILKIKQFDNNDQFQERK